MAKNPLKPWQHGEWRLPTRGAEFVAAMEDVLDLDAEPYDPASPTGCRDAKPVVLQTQTRPPLPVQPGAVERRDYAYVRQGTADLFVMVEPLAGWRQVAVTARRTRLDFADGVR
jgi:hypothetical protein